MSVDTMERRRLLAEWSHEYPKRPDDLESDDDYEDHVFRRAFALGTAESDQRTAADIHSIRRQLAKRDTRIAQLEGMINTPLTDDFILAIRLEAAHQIERWGAEHDAGKTAPDWFWLLGFLAGKAVQAAARGDTEKAKHHTISSAAVLLNWHRHLGGVTTIRPGIMPPAEES